ncbi:hypothetical protein JCM3765_005497 [Sporobolomyces pararoseus]
MTYSSRSLLSITDSLRTHLINSLPPTSTDHHSLSNLSSLTNPSQITSLRSNLTQTLETLRNSLESFRTLLPPPEEEDRERDVGLDKYLNLLLQSCQTESNLLSTISSTSINTPFHSREGYPILHPSEEQDSFSISNILERISKDLGLVSFRDDDHDEGEIGDSEKEKQKEVVTLSLGGKVMVVDFKIHRQTTNTTNSSTDSKREWIDTTEVTGNSNIKVSYVFKNEQFFNQNSSSQLLSIFRDYQEQGGEELWSRVYRILKELEQLDDRTSKEGSNYFGKFDQLKFRVEKEFNTFDSNSSSSGSSISSLVLPKIISNSSFGSLYPLLLISISPSALLNPLTLKFLFSSSSSTSPPRSGTLLRDFLNLQGVYVVEIGLPSSKNSTITTTTEEGGRGWYQIKLVSPPPQVERRVGVGVGVGIPISREIGKRISDLIIDPVPPQVEEGKEKVNGIVHHHHHQQVREGEGVEQVPLDDKRGRKKRSRNQHSTMTDLIKLSIWSSSRSSSSSNSNFSQTISFDDPSSFTTSPTSNSSRLPPNSFKFKLAENNQDQSHHQSETEEGGTRAFMFNNLWIPAKEEEESGEKEEEVGGGGGMKKLRKSIEILKEQILIDDLVFSVLGNPSLIEKSAKSQDEKEEDEKGTLSVVEVEDSNKRRKKRKLDTKEEMMTMMSLDDLFTTTTTNDSPLPVFIHLDPPLLSDHPTISISFPSPHLPPHESSPIIIHITSNTQGGFSYKVESKFKEVKDRLQVEVYDKGVKVLEKTRDLAIFLNWVVKKLC